MFLFLAQTPLTPPSACPSARYRSGEQVYTVEKMRLAQRAEGGMEALLLTRDDHPAWPPLCIYSAIAAGRDRAFTDSIEAIEVIAPQ
jgi:hypothetical protein